MGSKLADHRNGVQTRPTALHDVLDRRASIRAASDGRFAAIRQEVFITVGGNGATGPGAAPVPLLVYHDVSPVPHAAFRRYSVTVRQFARQMKWLATRGYQTIDLDALVRARLNGGTLPRRPVLITFDDGFQGCADHAVPVLGAHGFTAVFYPVTGLTGATSRWMARDLGVELPLMTWDTARALTSAGYQCDAHSVTHPRLTDRSVLMMPGCGRRLQKQGTSRPARRRVSLPGRRRPAGAPPTDSSWP